MAEWPETRATEPCTEQDEARARLKASIDALADQTNLHLHLQKEPLKLLGGASAVGAVLGLVMGRQFQRRQKVYVDATSPLKHQKALVRAQTQGPPGASSALIVTLGTLAVKTLSEKVLVPKLEALAEGLLSQVEKGVSASGTPSLRKDKPAQSVRKTDKDLNAEVEGSPITVTELSNPNLK